MVSIEEKSVVLDNEESTRTRDNHHIMVQVSLSPLVEHQSLQTVVRQSGRIASVGRTSYADLDEGEDEQSSDEYSSNGDAYEEEDFRPSKKARGRVTYAQKSSSTKVSLTMRKVKS
jgi:hypothetical protein